MEKRDLKIPYNINPQTLTEWIRADSHIIPAHEKKSIGIKYFLQ